MLLGTLGASFLRKLLSGKRMMRAGHGKVMLRAGYGLKKRLIPLHALKNFETQKYYENKPRFNGAFPRDNLPERIKTELM